MKEPFYISFGQSHAHRVNSKTFDCNSLCRIYAGSMSEARQAAFDAFGNKWHNAYTEPNLEYYPRGIIDLESETT